MARRSRPPEEHVARDPEDVLHVPAVEDRVAPPPAPPEPIIDSAAGTRAGGPDPSRGPQRKAAGSSPRHDAPPAREKTLHELNLEAREIDRDHALKREEAKAAAREHVEPILSGVMRPRLVPRPTQRNLRPPVRE